MHCSVGVRRPFDARDGRCDSCEDIARKPSCPLRLIGTLRRRQTGPVWALRALMLSMPSPPAS